MEKLQYKCMTKATDRESDGLRYSANWAMSKRGALKIYEDKITCGSWNFEKEKISSLILYKTKQMFIPVNVLAFEYDDKIYQFGLNPWANPIKHIGLEYKEELVKIKYSPYSIVIRFILIAMVFTIISGKFI